jgi:hypothetical protein
VIAADGRPALSVPDLVKELVHRMPRIGDAILEGEDALAGLLRGQHIFCPALSYKRHLVGEHPFDRSWHQVLDLDLLARLLFDGRQIVGLRSRAYRYRRHGSNETARLTATFERFEEEFAIYAEIGARARARGWRRAAEVARRYRIIRAHLWYRAVISALRGDRTGARACLARLRDFRRRSMVPA